MSTHHHKSLGVGRGTPGRTALRELGRFGPSISETLNPEDFTCAICGDFSLSGVCRECDDDLESRARHHFSQEH